MELKGAVPTGRRRVFVGQQKTLWQRLPDLLDRVDILQILEQQNEAACRDLAGRLDAPPEALFYLATEGSAETRRAIAANPSTPAQANRHLADDADDEVRVELARKIGQILPNLPPDASRRLRELTIETL